MSDPRATEPGDIGRLRQQLQWEQRARLLLETIASGAFIGETVEQVLGGALGRICEHMAWPIGHVYVPAPDGSGDLVSARLWHVEEPARFGDFQRLTEATRLPPGAGLPGRVLSRRQPAWIRDVTQDENFPRAHHLPGFGIRAAFGLPVFESGAVSAVLEFFSDKEMPADEPLLQVMSHIGRQLGHAIERGRAEAALRKSESRFRSVTHSAADAIISADSSGLIISWNRGAERMFGYSEAEATGRPLTLIIPARHQQAHERAMERMNHGGPARVMGRTVELEGLRRDGGEFPLELSLATWQIGEERFYSGVLRDISERRLAEERLRAAATRLEISERAALAAKEEALRQEQLARQASLAKSSFLAHMSHELRTPLNVILGFSQLMQRDRTLQPEQRENLSIILRSGEHLLGLINDVLSLSKIEAGQASMADDAFNLHRLLAVLEASFRLRVESKGLSLSFEQAPGLPEIVRGDEGKLRQVLINLLGNAVKFTGSGAVTLRADWADDVATFTIADTGPGISAEDLEKLFQPFFQADAGQRDKNGTGLGLALSRSFARLMGGDLRVRSEPGRGSTFSLEVRLPTTGPGEVAPEYIPVIGLQEGEPGRRILVADDDADNRLLLLRLMSAVGLEVRGVADGAQAVSVWESWQPDLIWMDMRMPVIDGYQATRQIRARERERPDLRRTVIVALTASAFEHERDALLAVGCDSYVPKPYSEARIFAVLEDRLGLRFARTAMAAAPGERPRSDKTRELAALPAPVLLGLRRALTIGDDLGAHRALDQVAPGNPALAGELREMLKTFQFDEVLALIEDAEAEGSR